MPSPPFSISVNFSRRIFLSSFVCARALHCQRTYLVGYALPIHLLAAPIQQLERHILARAFAFALALALHRNAFLESLKQQLRMFARRQAQMTLFMYAGAT
jgi:hypothetical protein